MNFKSKKIEVMKLMTSISFLFVFLLFSCSKITDEGPYFGTGIKIGEVTQDGVIVWARLTANPARVGNDAPMPDFEYKDPKTGEMKKRSGRPDASPIVIYPEGYDVNNIQGATPGKDGMARLSYRETGQEKWTQTEWIPVDPEKSFTHQFGLSGLSAGTKYEILVEASPTGKKVSASIEGKFGTATAPDVPSDVNFIVTTGTSYQDIDSDMGYKFYMSSLKLDPDFFVHTGDIVYYDGAAKTIDLARWHWDRMYSLPNNIEFHRHIASYFIKDDHDTWMNDCYPDLKTNFMGDFTFEQGKQVFLDEVPMGEKTYRTFRWGKDLQIWLVEGRDYRSPNDMPDGPDKTIWGKEQMEWFKTTVLNSDATYKVLISPTPIVGPDRGNKNDNHANEGFQYEGDKLREFISKQNNMVTVCGDRHWQYVSKDAKTGLVEFSCGPGSDAHAGGWKQEDKLPEHIYLNVVGGFLEGSVSQINGKPNLIFRHFNPDGKLLNEYDVKSN